MPRRKSKFKFSASGWFKKQNLFFFTNAFCLLLCVFLYIFFRMKGVEQDYQVNTLSKSVKKQNLEYKKLKAQHARLLSVKNLRKLAKSFDMKEPGPSKIIAIPH